MIHEFSDPGRIGRLPGERKKIRRPTRKLTVAHLTLVMWKEREGAEKTDCPKRAIQNWSERKERKKEKGKDRR